MSLHNLKKSLPLAIIISFAIILLSDFYSPYAEVAILSGVPFLWKAAKTATPINFGLGFFVTLALILSNPPENVWKMSVILGSITGLPALLILAIYPLLIAAIAASSAFIFASLIRPSKQRREATAKEAKESV
ncbi:MAG: hypothetical protein QXV22_04895 [Thermoplasmataceae archaeon]